MAQVVQEPQNTPEEQQQEEEYNEQVSGFRCLITLTSVLIPILAQLDITEQT